MSNGYRFVLHIFISIDIFLNTNLQALCSYKIFISAFFLM